MASSPVSSWQIDGEKMETVTDFFFLGSKITAVGDCRGTHKHTEDTHSERDTNIVRDTHT